MCERRLEERTGKEGSSNGESVKGDWRREQERKGVAMESCAISNWRRERERKGVAMESVQ